MVATVGCVAAVSETYTFLLAIKTCSIDPFVIVGLFAGHSLALYLGWRSWTEYTAGGTETDYGTLSEDVTFTVLKNQRRREALRYLRRVGGESCLSDVAEHVAARENGVERRELSSTQRKRAYVSLHQSHLPMMNDAGVVAFDQDRGDVELLDAASELFEHIDVAPDANGGRRFDWWRVAKIHISLCGSD